jgi:hypothetical protein
VLRMRIWVYLVVGLGLAGRMAAGQDVDGLALVRKAVKSSTLDQAGTHPFHLRATLAPSFDRDKASGRTGSVEIWWTGVGHFRREVRSPGFQQVEVVDGGRVWQKNEGDYLPAWLAEISEALLHPVSDQSLAMKGVAPDKVNAERSQFASVYLNWEKPLPMDMQPSKEGISISSVTGLLSYGGGLGWGAGFSDYRDFHGRSVAMKLSHGSPEVTAKVEVLEDLGTVSPGWLDASAPGGDLHPIRLVTIAGTDLAKDAEGTTPIVWPEVKDGPLEGVIWTDLVVDRAGTIREPFSTISDNPLINGYMHDYLAALRFKPVLRDGESVETVRHVVLRFKLHRPAGVEDLGTARAAFERGRVMSSLAFGTGTSYAMTGKFTVKLASGTVNGTYTDTWKDAQHWKREAVCDGGRVDRSQDGDQQYLWVDGPQGGLARLVMTAVEPLPAGDTMTESDWRLRREMVDGVSTLRVTRGEVDHANPKTSNGYWFDESGRLVQAYASKLALSYSGYRPVAEGAVPTTIAGRVAAGGTVVMQIDLEEPVPLSAATLGKNSFRVPGHEWKRQFTAEVR